MPDQLDRKSTRLREFDYSAGHTYFVTVCTHNRQHIFGSIVEDCMILNPFGTAVQAAWDETVAMRRELVHHGFVVMPNHVHAPFSLDPSALVGSNEAALGVDPDALQSVTTPSAGAVARARRPHSVSTIVGGFKGDATRRIRALTLDQSFVVWQERFHDRVVRNSQEFETIAEYIQTNPARWESDLFCRQE